MFIKPKSPKFTRRTFLMSGGATVAAASAGLLSGCGPQGGSSPFQLQVKPSRLNVFEGQPAKTHVWGYNGKVAGPTLHMKKDQPFILNFKNDLPEPTSVHWHGLRIPFGMDGVGSITQDGVQPGESFHYEFSPPDAGLFWYHPHMNSEKQVARGMFGLIVVEEDNPPEVDREIIWSLYDWGLDANYQVPKSKAFEIWRGTDIYTTHTKITTNGLTAPDITLRRGERVRLRIANTSGNRRYALRFGGHNPTVIAWDANAVTPYKVEDEPLLIGTGSRVDLILDGTGEVGQDYVIDDVFNKDYEPIPPWETPEQIAARKPEKVCRILYEDVPALRRLTDLPPPVAPVLNHVPEPDLSNPVIVDIDLGQKMVPIKDIPAIGPMAAVIAAKQGVPANEEVALWTMNDKVLMEDLTTFACINPVPLFECKLGLTYLLRFKNTTRVDHPTHIHGHTFKLISIDGKAPPRDMYLDTFNIFAGQTAEIAFVADNPGEWMIHCHRGMHQHGGMMSTFTVC